MGLKSGDSFLLDGKIITAVKIESSTIIPVSGKDYQLWWVIDEKGNRYCEWLPIGVSNECYNYFNQYAR